jgi:hypothetical protein
LQSIARDGYEELAMVHPNLAHCTKDAQLVLLGCHHLDKVYLARLDKQIWWKQQVGGHMRQGEQEHHAMALAQLHGLACCHCTALAAALATLGGMHEQGCIILSNTWHAYMPANMIVAATAASKQPHAAPPQLTLSQPSIVLALYSCM